MHTRLFALPILALTLVIATPWAALAQLYHATIVGIVVDSSGAVVPGAKVEALELATNVAANSLAEGNGNYRISPLRPGRYRVHVEAPGFKKYTVENVELKVGAVVRLDVKLEVGAHADQVTVQAEAPLVETESAQRGSSVNV